MDTNPNFPINGGGTNGVTNILTSTSQKHDGPNSLAVPAVIDFVTTYLASVTVPLCQSSATVNVGGLTMSAWVFIHGSSLSPLSGVSFAAWGPSGFENQPV